MNPVGRRRAVMLGGGVVLGVLSFLLVQPESPSSAGAGLFALGSPSPSAPSTTTTSTVPTTVATASTTTMAVPETTTTTTMPPSIVIHGVGDVNLDPSYIPALAANGFDHAFEVVGPYFVDDDLTVINLECSPSPLGSPLPKEFTFQCPPEALPALERGGVDVANLGNNHSMDFGMEAMLDGIEQVEKAGVRVVGVGANREAATSPALFEIGGRTVAVLGMGGVVPAQWWLATDDGPGMASGDDIPQMVEAVTKAAEVADIVVVTIHWGWELETEPREDDRQRAEAMIEAGADVIFGHHPHRLGDLEFIDGKPVYWTLGNFVWPRLSDAGATTAIARVVIHPDDSLEACMIPAFIETPGRPVVTGDTPCGVDR